MQVITKGVSKIVEIGYIITIIKREYVNGTLEATVFREIRDFITFHVFLILYQFVSKYLL